MKELFVLLSRNEIQGAYGMESVDSLLGVFTTRELADAAFEVYQSNQAYACDEKIIVEVELDNTYTYALN